MDTAAGFESHERSRNHEHAAMPPVVEGPHQFSQEAQSDYPAPGCTAEEPPTSQSLWRGAGGSGTTPEKDGVVSLSGALAGLSCCSGSPGLRAAGCLCGMWAASLLTPAPRGRARLGLGGWAKHLHLSTSSN